MLRRRRKNELDALKDAFMGEVHRDFIPRSASDELGEVGAGFDAYSINGHQFVADLRQ